MSRQSRVKNKSAAPVQITAEQILREAEDRQEAAHQVPNQHIHDYDELQDYRLSKRKSFEDNIRKDRNNMSYWLKYAAWEAEQKDFKRARSVYERAFDVDYKNPRLWLKYAEMEMIHGNVNRARNIWDRAITLLPRVDQFWLKYVYMEDALGNFAAVRQVLERWMEWAPGEQAWNVYLKFETRHKEYNRTRLVFNRYVQIHPTVRTWLKYARWEIKLGEFERAREVFTQAMEQLGDAANDERLFIEFASFEVRCKEYERAREIYKYALDKIPKHKATELYKRFISFEKQHGEQKSIEDVILRKRRFQYEQELKADEKNYDIWFDYLRLEEGNLDGKVGEDRSRAIGGIRELFERAISNTPPSATTTTSSSSSTTTTSSIKSFWRRYIFLWIQYALFEELSANDNARAREVYKQCIALIPHKSFSFSKIWILFANFEIRQLNLKAARSVFGHAIGLSNKSKIFEAYIQLELKLGNIDRCRKLYEIWLSKSPEKCDIWCKFAELEISLQENERARAIFELAVKQPLLDMPELVWKSFIDFEIENVNFAGVRSLYNRLLERTQHVKVWISFAQFEETIEKNDNARAIYIRAYKALKSVEDKEERLMLVEAWNAFEKENGNEIQQNVARNAIPERIKKKRRITENGQEGPWEEYYDYVFPDEKNTGPNLKILEIAKKWKKQKVDS